MGKRKSTRKKSSGGVVTNSNNYCCVGGSGSKNDKYAAFDFTEDDVEIESRKALAKFGAKSPSGKPVHHRKSVDKYTFLQFFTRGQQNDSGNDTRDVDLTESGFVGTDVTMSLGSLKYESQLSSFPKFQGSEYSRGEKSCAQRSRRPECYTAGKEHNKIFYVDSSDDGNMECRSSSSLNLTENEGSLKDRSSEYDADSNDCETVVAVVPNYVKYGKKYYTRCQLTFSQKCIRLKGSPLPDRKRTCCLEWSTSDILNIECQQCESVKADVVNLHMKPKVTNVGDTDHWNSGSVELEFVIHDDPQWSKKQEEIKSLDPKFKAAWKINVTEYSFKESFEVLVYPDGDPDAVFISRRDIDLLRPGTFINDTIIDFYFKYLSGKIRTKERHRFHFFNTFFFQKLDALRRDSSRAKERQDAFHSVRKWTKNVNIFETDYIFVPVNFSLHWSLIIICHPGKVAYLRDKVIDASPMVPCILHMDSIRGSHGGLENLIRCYLLEEWKERGNKHDKDILKKFLNLEFVSLQLPQQENWFDCGLFLLHYAELFLEQASNSSTTEFFDILNKDWFLPAEVSLRKRDHIRKVIHKIVEDNALKDPPAARDNKYFQSYEGDSSVKLMEKNSVKESCSGVKLNSSDDLDIKGQQSPVAMLEQRSSDKSAIDECFKPSKLLMPINQFSNLCLPMETWKQATSQNGDTTSRCYFDSPMPTRCRLNSDFRIEKMKETSKTRSDESLIMIDCDPGRYNDKHSSSSEDLASCIVEDSEDESGPESIPRIRPSPFNNSPVRFHI
ncbi:hypothetical protein ACS0TY_002907 [Phlomoides rotata]